MLTEYIRAAMKHATYKTYDDGTVFGEIPILPGVWAHADTREACQTDLRDALEDWIAVGLYLHHPFPDIDGVSLMTGDDAKLDLMHPLHLDQRLILERR